MQKLTIKRAIERIRAEFKAEPQLDEIPRATQGMADFATGAGLFYAYSKIFDWTNQTLHKYGADFAGPFGLYLILRIGYYEIVKKMHKENQNFIEKLGKTRIVAATTTLGYCYLWEGAQYIKNSTGYDPKDYLAYTLGVVSAIGVEKICTRKHE